MNYRNGRRINVGDILWAENARWIVTDNYQMRLIGKEMELTQMILPAFVEYVGNIHDNPELLSSNR